MTCINNEQRARDQFTRLFEPKQESRPAQAPTQSQQLSPRRTFKVRKAGK